MVHGIAAALRRQFGREWPKSLLESFEAFERSLARADRLGDFGWTLPASCSFDEFAALLNAADDQATADAAFVHFYTDDDGRQLRELFAFLRTSDPRTPAFADWSALVVELEAAIAQSMYRVATPALLALNDSLINSLLSRDYWYSDGRRQFFEERRRAFAPDSFEAIAWRNLQAFTERLHANAGPDGVPEHLNRHWVAHHGIARGRLDDCLRLLQAAATILYLHSQAQDFLPSTPAAAEFPLDAPAPKRRRRRRRRAASTPR